MINELMEFAAEVNRLKELRFAVDRLLSEQNLQICSPHYAELYNDRFINVGGTSYRDEKATPNKWSVREIERTSIPKSSAFYKFTDAAKSNGVIFEADTYIECLNFVFNKMSEQLKADV